MSDVLKETLAANRKRAARLRKSGYLWAPSMAARADQIAAKIREATNGR